MTETSTSGAGAVVPADRDDGNGDAIPPFPFPFQPYPIQTQFMRQLYKTLQQGNVGIFESPTGTGKSMSIICSALTWLKEQHSAKEVTVSSEEVSSKEPAWVQAFARKRKIDEIAEALEKRRRTVAKQHRRVRRFQKQTSGREMLRRAIARESSDGQTGHGSDSDLIDQYASGQEEEQRSSGLVDKLYSSDSSSGLSEDENEPEEYVIPKMFYCSRTHTQLSQFTNEIRRTPFWTQLRIVPLASRGTLCINSKVRQAAHQHPSRINEICLDMQKAKPAKSKDGRLAEFLNEQDAIKPVKEHECPFMGSNAIKLLKDHIHVEPHDIEDLVGLGRKLHTCPYYATRSAVPGAHVVTLPYNSLLSQHTRESLDVDVQGSVVIVDEAHNIIETINAVHSCEVTYVQVNQMVLQLGDYMQKYQSRLLPKNKANIKQLLTLMKKFLVLLSEVPRQSGPPSSSVEKVAEQDDTGMVMTMMSINDFLFKLSIDNINLFEVVNFIQSSNIIRKLNGVLEKQKQAERTGHSSVQIHHPKSSAISPEYSVQDFHNTQLHSVEQFLGVLTGADQDGRMMIFQHRMETSKNMLKFVSLNPSIYFNSITETARSVILAGGTMQPISAVVTELFGHLTPSKVDIFTCDHVVAQSNLVAVSLERGPTGLPFDFTFGKRSSAEMIAELGRLVVNLVNITPDGMVLFFPSYQYEGQVYQKWLADGVISRIEQKKKLFRESRSGGATEDVLQAYCIKVKGDFERSAKADPSPCPLGKATARGAILSCVIGGKMSEGINFSDYLGRCIVVVGLPYAPPNDLLITEKMAYLSTKFGTKAAGEAYYENLCMKGVNQSIGRAIRHADDYATIVLADQRYSRSRVSSALPNWIRKSLAHHATFASAFQQLRNFHLSKLATISNSQGSGH